MKTLRYLSGASIIGCMLIFAGCDDDEPQVNVGPLTTSSIVAEGTDPGTGESVSRELASGSTTADVPTDATITVTFSKDVDAATITADNVQLTQDGNVVATSLNTSGAAVTISPNAALAEETDYTLTLGSGIVASDGGAFTQTTRSFTTVGASGPDEEGLVAHWTFEENAEDQAGNYDADEVIDIEYVEGRSEAAGMAASFNGTTSIIEVPNGAELVTTEDFTLSFWMKIDPNHLNSEGNQKGYFVMGVGGFHGFQFEVANDRETAKLVARYDRGEESGAEDLWLDASGDLGWQGWTHSEDLSDEGGLSALLDDTWAHIVCVYDSETMVGSIYVNGRLMKSQDFNLYGEEHPAINTLGLTFNEQDGVGDKFAIGFYSDRSTTAFDFADYNNPEHNHFKGELDDIKIYHAAKTTEEVEAMYEAEKP